MNRKVLVGGWGEAYNLDESMPILDERSLEFLSHSPEQTQRLGVRLGELIRSSDLVCLAGDLGSGKTTFAQGIARGWGSLDPVTSPTFVLINEYRRADSLPMHHIDAFRLKGEQDVWSLGLDDVIGNHGPVLIEWPDRLIEFLPQQYLWVDLGWVDDSRRQLRFSAHGNGYERLLRDYRKAAFGG